MQQNNSGHIGGVESPTVTVWDRFLRFFHWTLVLCFATAFISGEVHASTLHVLVGYLLCVLLAARVYWGFKGSEYARFRAFIYPISEAFEYLRSMIKGNPRHYYGHNPAGALMVFTMFGLLAVIFVSGLLTLGTIDFEGPLVFLANRVSDECQLHVPSSPRIPAACCARVGNAASPGCAGRQYSTQGKSGAGDAHRKKIPAIAFQFNP